MVVAPLLGRCFSTSSSAATHTAPNLKVLLLKGPVSIVQALAVGKGSLFAACQNGDILAWKPCLQTNTFVPAAKLGGHSRAVNSLAVAGNQSTIKVWDLDTFQCTQTMESHSDAMTSLLAWDSYLLSGSQDSTIKVWVASQQSGKMEVTYSHKVFGG